MPRQLKVAPTRLLHDVVKNHAKFVDKTIEQEVIELLCRLDQDLDVGEYAVSTGEGSVEEATQSLTETVVEYEEGLEVKTLEKEEEEDDDDDESSTEDEDDD